MYIDKKAISNQRGAARRSLRVAQQKADDERRQQAKIRMEYGLPVMDKRDRDQAAKWAAVSATATISNRVLASFGIDPAIDVRRGECNGDKMLQAYTDFKKIWLTVDTTHLNLKDIDNVAEFISAVKGAVYHEGGHILYTTPFRQLQDAWTDFHGSGKLFDVWAPLGGGYAVNNAWNILEDQRMESAMVNASPILRRYFTSIVVNVVMDRSCPGMAWPFVTARNYLPRELRNAVLAHANTFPNADIIPDIDRVADEYRTCKDPVRQFDLVHEFAALMSKWGGSPYGSGTHGAHNPSAERKDNPQEVPEGNGHNNDPEGDKKDGAQSQSGDGQELGKSTAPTDDDGTGDPQHPGGNYIASQDQPDNAQPGSGSSSGATPRDDAKDKAKEVLEKIAEQLSNDNREAHQREAREFVSNVNDSVRHDIKGNTTRSAMPLNKVEQANAVTNGIVGALEHLLDHTSPCWRFRLENGVIDPTSFLTRTAGDTDYWSGLEGDGANGYDLSVSVVLDTSYSMENATDPLSVVAYAIRNACDIIGVPCSVNTFASEVQALYRADEAAVPYMIKADGGTYPRQAFDLLDSQRGECKRHLVLILTDGEWEGVDTLAPWEAPGRYFVLLGFRMYKESLARRKPNEAVSIWSIDDLPNVFTRSIAGFIA